MTPDALREEIQKEMQARAGGPMPLMLVSKAVSVALRLVLRERKKRGHMQNCRCGLGPYSDNEGYDDYDDYVDKGCAPPSEPKP